jgi:RNA polymerase-binding transcription factor
MGIAPESSNSNRRLQALRQILTRLRDETYQKITEFRRDQGQESLSSPGDEMDQARSATDVETHASLIERAEDRLRLIDEALARVNSGSYGICAECGEDIPVERLKALPFALFCVDCQEKRGKGRGRWGAGGTSERYGERWTPPADLEAHDADEYRVRNPEEAVSAHDDEPFGPDEGEGGEPGGAPKRRRGRPRKTPAKG